MASVVEGSGTPKPSPPGRGTTSARGGVSPVTGKPLVIHRSWMQAVLYGLRRQAWPLVTYLARTDVHTFAFSVACNAILSFFPFVVLLLTISRRVFHSQAMVDVIINLLRDYLPTGQEFVIRNVKVLANARSNVQVFSLFILLFTSTGVFLPLEVALNRVWDFRKNRSYLGNQVMALGLAFASGCLALLSIAATATNQLWLHYLFLGDVNLVSRTVGYVVMKVCAVLASIAIFFLIYWLLPNGKVPARAVMPAAIIAGLLLELAKYGYVISLPRLNFQEIYGPFSISVTLIFWAFLAGLILLTGARLSAVGRIAENQ